jgi:hypothetical protein
MIHPDTELKFVSPEVGYGIFATAFMPMGTIVYVEDPLDIKISAENALLQDDRYKGFIKKYSVRDRQGNYILCWDNAKYVNHCCQFNTISTGYDFEIAIRDIEAGEQITDEYGLFNLEEEIHLICNHSNCRGKVCSSDVDGYRTQWDEMIKGALRRLQHIPQPLMPHLDAITYGDLMNYLTTGENYRSVAELTGLQPVAASI